LHESSEDFSAAATDVGSVAVVGRGRLGTVLVKALTEVGVQVSGPHGRGYRGRADGIDSSRPALVVLCVPDAEIAHAAERIEPGPLVAHCSGTTGLPAISPHRGFSMHPVMTFTFAAQPSIFKGIGAAVEATDAAAAASAKSLTTCLGIRPFTVAPDDRAAYHAATSMAANFLITLEWAAGRLAQSAAVDPAVLLPLVRASVENWALDGSAALTGPVARGDEGTVAAQRAGIERRLPDLLPLFDAMVISTRAMAGREQFR